MKWQRERELLIAQAMAFARSVTGKNPETDAKVDSSSSAVKFEQLESPVEAAETPRRLPAARSPFAKELKAGGGFPRSSTALRSGARQAFQLGVDGHSRCDHGPVEGVAAVSPGCPARTPV